MVLGEQRGIRVLCVVLCCVCVAISRQKRNGQHNPSDLSLCDGLANPPARCPRYPPAGPCLHGAGVREPDMHGDVRAKLEAEERKLLRREGHVRVRRRLPRLPVHPSGQDLLPRQPPRMRACKGRQYVRLAVIGRGEEGEGGGEGEIEN